jgi:hypothetical protein
MFSTDFRKKKAQILNFIKIRPVGAESFNADGRTEGYDEVVVAFRNFANAHKNEN